MSKEGIEACRNLLTLLGLDLEDPNFRETPELFKRGH